MVSGGKGSLQERIRRGVRTVFFVLTMVASLLVLSAPVLIAVGDVAVSLALASMFACGRSYSLKEHLRRYSFRSSLMDIPIISILRSLVIACVYSFFTSPGLSHGLYLGTTTLCSLASLLILSIKACFFRSSADSLPSLTREKLHLMKKSCGMPVLFLFSLLFALGHVVVAYRTSYRARRKLLFHRGDPEAVLVCNVFSTCKVPRSPTASNARYTKGNNQIRKKAIVRDEKDLPVSFLADFDSLFVACQGLLVHYKVSLFESTTSCSLASSPIKESSPDASPQSISSTRLKLERPMTVAPKGQHQMNRSPSNQFQDSSLYAPLLADSATSPSLLSDENPVSCLDDGHIDTCSSNSLTSSFGVEERGKVAVVMVHGFGGGVFSWRHVMSMMARHIGCPVVAFDRPGWGLTSRPRKKDWEDKHLPNPYKMESQVDLLISFCLEMGFSSVILVGHDDGGILALKAAAKLRACADSVKVEVKGVVLLSVSLSREVVPAFARILLHTSLGKKHLVRPLLRTEITQVINQRAWFDATKLTEEVLSHYKAPLFLEGWDEALHEIGRHSFATVLSTRNAEALLKSVEDLPILVVAGAEDALVPLKSAQAMASKLLNSRLVAVSGCGHLPHEECPKALLAALSPFISRLFSLPAADASRRQ